MTPPAGLLRVGKLEDGARDDASFGSSEVQRKVQPRASSKLGTKQIKAKHTLQTKQVVR